MKKIENYSADSAIEGKQNDILGRLPFAENLAEAVLGWSQPESLVIGLYGKWGSGKSSIKNLVKEYLEATTTSNSKSSCAYIEFNPWQYSNDHLLYSGFFKELEKGLLNQIQKKESEKFKSNYYAYATLLTCVTPFLAIAAAEYFKSHGLDMSQSVQATLLTKGVLDSGQVLMNYSAKEESGKTQDTLFEVKTRLSNLLKNRKGTLLVIIDDIDRLSKEEIRSIMRLVKVNCDFPKVVYLLCFQRNIIEDALNEGSINGKDFLEKIIQVNFDVPQLEVDVLRTKLDGTVKNLVANFKLKTQFDDKRWKEIFFQIEPFFENFRQVKRFQNALTFYLGLLKKNQIIEVDPIDLILVEIMRTFFPNTHSEIYKSKNLIFDVKTMYLKGRFERNNVSNMQQEFEKDLKISPSNESLVKLFSLIFPFTGWIWNISPREETDENLWIKQLRVCHKVCFDRYFLLSIPRRDISQERFEKLFAKVVNGQLVKNELKEFKENGTINSVLDRLDANRKRIPYSAQERYLIQLMDLDDESNSSENFEFVFNRTLESISPQERDPLLHKVISKTVCVRALLLLTRTLVKDAEESTSRPFIRNECNNEIRSLISKRVYRIINQSRAGEYSDLAILVFWWFRSDNGKFAKNWVQKFSKTEIGLIQLFNSLIGPVIDNLIQLENSRSIWTPDYKWLKLWLTSFDTLENWKEKIRNLEESEKITEEHRRLTAAAKVLLERIEDPDFKEPISLNRLN